MNIKLPFFGELNSNSLKDYYELQTQLGGNTVQLDLNFSGAKIEDHKLLIVKDYLDEVSKIINIAEKELLNDYENGEEVLEYLSYHIEEIDKEELDGFLVNADKSLSLEKQLFSILKLRRIGFYPADENDFATLDFTLGEKVSQYLLVVKMNDRKSVEYITMES